MRKLLLRLIRDERGTAAIEMAVVGPPFLLTMLSIVELGLILTTQALLDGATRDAARLIMTGQVSAAGNTIGTFQTQLCNDMTMLINNSTCTNDVLIDVISTTNTTDFAGLAFAPCSSNAGSGGSNPCPFNPGTCANLVAVQVVYNRPFIIPWVGALLSLASNSQNTTLQSTVVFENEPFCT
jgi:Flp pilus assembly protein TadG